MTVLLLTILQKMALNLLPVCITLTAYIRKLIVKHITKNYEIPLS